jgi:hypothetical protein
MILYMTIIYSSFCPFSLAPFFWRQWTWPYQLYKQCQPLSYDEPSNTYSRSLEVSARFSTVILLVFIFLLNSHTHTNLYHMIDNFCKSKIHLKRSKLWYRRKYDKGESGIRFEYYYFLNEIGTKMERSLQIIFRVIFFFLCLQKFCFDSKFRLFFYFYLFLLFSSSILLEKYSNLAYIYKCMFVLFCNSVFEYRSIILQSSELLFVCFFGATGLSLASSSIIVIFSLPEFHF